MSKRTLVCCVAGLLLVLPTRATSAEPQLCGLAASIIEQMNLEVAAGGRIDPVVLTGSIAFLQECPSSVIPAFERFANNERDLRRSWVEALQSATKVPSNGDLRGFLVAAKRSVDRGGNAPLREFLDGIFGLSGEAWEKQPRPPGYLFGRLSLATLRQFSHCDAAECYSVSDFLLFLLGTHPVAFFGAMHADQVDATKWLSQLGDLSFAGDPSESQRRDSMRKFLFERVSESKAPRFQREKHQCENTLRRVRFRAWK